LDQTIVDCEANDAFDIPVLNGERFSQILTFLIWWAMASEPFVRPVTQREKQRNGPVVRYFKVREESLTLVGVLRRGRIRLRYRVYHLCVRATHREATAKNSHPHWGWLSATIAELFESTIALRM
jgi:hypothetical protein